MERSPLKKANNYPQQSYLDRLPLFFPLSERSLRGFLFITTVEPSTDVTELMNVIDGPC
jgi:hypothetical protein